MRTQSIHTNEITPRPLFGRLNSMQQHVMKTRSNIATIGVLLVTLLFALPGFGQTIRNSSFEQVQIGYPYQSSVPSDIPYWTHTGPVGDALIGVIGGPAEVTVAGAGKQFVTLGGGTPAKEAQVGRQLSGLVPGNYYASGLQDR